MIQAIVFDLGGIIVYDVWEHLLLDPEQGIASLYGLPPDQVKAVGQELWEEFAYRPVLHQDSWRQLERDYWNRFVQKTGLAQSPDVFIQMTDPFIRTVDGMIPLLERLAASGIDLAICSNNNEFWFKRQIDKFGFDKFFDPEKIILSSRVGVSKSSPDYQMFKAAVAALGIDRTQCLFIDDRKENIEHALQFGMAALFFPSISTQGAHYLTRLLQEMRLLK